MLVQYFPPVLDYSKLEVHAVLLADRSRIDSYLAAITDIITPGLRVVELGAGIGVFGRHAARLGAEVYLVEREERLASLARLLNVLITNDKPSYVIHKSIETTSLPPCDVVIHELLGPRLLDEGICRLLCSFADNNHWYSLPGTVLIPEAATLWCRAVFVNPDAFMTPLPSWSEVTKTHSERRQLLSTKPSPLIWATSAADLTPRSAWEYVAKFDFQRPGEWVNSFEITTQLTGDTNAILWGFTAHLTDSHEIDVKLGSYPATSWGGIIEQLPCKRVVPTGYYRFKGDLPCKSDNRASEMSTWLNGVSSIERRGDV